MARYVADDVQTRVRNPRRGSGFPRRFGGYGQLVTGEMTSRIGSADIGRTLYSLAVEFDPGWASTEATLARIRQSDTGGTQPDRPAILPYDVVLATSMLQVGVDVQRLGLMLVVGQPKNTAEYIQASSRVGRSSARPGLVVTLGNWARPRDLAHFEQFRHYHETFYAQVEALSVTPFSPTSLERGIDGVPGQRGPGDQRAPHRRPVPGAQRGADRRPGRPHGHADGPVAGQDRAGGPAA